MDEEQNERKRSETSTSCEEQQETKRSKSLISQERLRLGREENVRGGRMEARAGLPHWGTVGTTSFVISTQLEFLKSRMTDTGISVPTVIVIVSPFPPINKIAIIHKRSEEVVDMEEMNTTWVPCIPPGERATATPEYTEFGPNSRFYLPYFRNPYEVDKKKHKTVVDIVYPTEAGPIVREFDWKFHMIEAMEKHIQDVKELRRTNKEAAAAFENMRFYKFYPAATPDTPDLSYDKVCTASESNLFRGGSGSDRLAGGTRLAESNLASKRTSD
ncbi:hypothetical protein QVD17_22689 [Tagetes erecta]|uniref:Uncharacterized protein n=1 Tax=Tagetes erecta TaxID=13708 RepID=A0AAD8NU46_TARER|nr:hypothetical protein QVD17_22689 [Tagetes erecta]